MSQTRTRPSFVLLAEDDEDDYLLTAEAFEEAGLAATLRRVADGEELLEYLGATRSPSVASPAGESRRAHSNPLPDLILLDLNMPRMDGRTALRVLRRDERLRHIPVVILTTSRSQEDILDSYRDGVNSYLRKPVSFRGLVETLEVLDRYWFDVAALPASREQVG